VMGISVDGVEEHKRRKGGHVLSCAPL